MSVTPERGEVAIELEDTDRTMSHVDCQYDHDDTSTSLHSHIICLRNLVRMWMGRLMWILNDFTSARYKIHQ